MNEVAVLGKRAIREVLRTPDALFPAFFIPMFFLVVNVGQAARLFPAGNTDFLNGQNYGAFQLPSSILLAASFGSAALFLVEDIEGGYFDKLRASPAPRFALVIGRLIAEGAKTVVLTTIMIALAMVFGIRIASGPLGFLLILVLTALWAVVYTAFMQLIALRTRSSAATQSGGLIFFPLLFLTPNFVPRDELTPAMRTAATYNPVTYIMEALRSLVLDDTLTAKVGWGFLVVGILGAVAIALNIRSVNRYD